MNIEHFLNFKGTSWMDTDSHESDIVMSTRIRLARNLMNYRFPTMFSLEESEQVEKELLNCLMKADSNKYHFSYFPIKELSALQRQILVEKHLISPYLANMESTGSVFITKDESLSVMVNEEDHLRIQSICPGFQLVEAYEDAIMLHQFVADQIDLAYDDQFGYLTSCPTNVGTGLRASVMIHLPALTMTKKMNHLIHTLTRLGMTVRGIYGEGSENTGNIYQISNQVTLGKSDKEILDELQEVISHIILKERLARKQLMEKASVILEDRLFRSLGTLKYAKILSSEEAANCLSNVRFGVDIGLIEDITRSQLNECMLLVQPGFVQQFAGATLKPAERDLYRAKILQHQLLSKEEMKNEHNKGDGNYDV